MYNYCIENKLNSYLFVLDTVSESSVKNINNNNKANEREQNQK